MALSQSTSRSHLPQLSSNHLIASNVHLPSPDQEVVHLAPSLSNSSASSPLLDFSNRLTTNKHRQSTHSTSSTKQNRGGLFTLAALARGKTTHALASFSEPSIRSRPSSGSLYRTAQSSPTSPLPNSSISTKSAADSQVLSTDNFDHLPNHNSSSDNLLHKRSETVNSANLPKSLLETDPPSQAYSNTAADTQAPIAFVPDTNYSKMHQTSSRLLRMTTDDRPFTRVC